MLSEFPIKLVKHIKTGRVYQYMHSSIYEPTLERVVSYKNISDGSIWTRPETEFKDPERFQDIGQIHK